MRAMMPAIAGDAAEVPPISPTVGSFAGNGVPMHAPQSETQIRYALKKKPFPAKSETSGMSRFPSLGIPETPVCQLGFAYPPEQLVGSGFTVMRVVLLVVQLLAPPPPPTEFTRSRAACSLLEVICPLASK